LRRASARCCRSTSSVAISPLLDFSLRDFSLL
jgi:hypothetical protein